MIHPQLGVSTWSLHRRLGTVYQDVLHGTGRTGTNTWGEPETPLIDVPRECAEHGFGTLEICHFHIPETTPEYLSELRNALDVNQVILQSVLIDEGDFAHPDPDMRQRDLDIACRWVEAAASLGAGRVRISAGDQPATSETLETSAVMIGQLAAFAKNYGVRVEIENWKQLLQTPGATLTLLGLLADQVGLKLDFGNWPAPRKYADLPRIARLATSTHAKADFSSGAFNQDDFLQCCDICRDADYHGAYILVFDGPGDEWEALDQIAATVRPYLGDTPTI